MNKQYKASTQIGIADKRTVSIYGTDFVKDLCPHFPSRDRERLYPNLSSAIEDTNAPSLVSCDNIYGEGASILWLQVQLTEVMMFTGIRDKMTFAQRDACATQLRRMGFYVRLSEMMQFFTRFEQGYYKTFQGYERPNPQIITESFLQFLDDLENARKVYYERVRQERESKERAKWDKEAVPYPEHIKNKLERLHNNLNANVQLSKKESSEYGAQS